MARQFANPFRIRSTLKPRVAQPSWWMQFSAVAWAIGVPVGMLILTHGNFDTWVYSLVMSASAAAAIVQWIFGISVTRGLMQLRAKVIRAGGRVCTSCGYDLTTAPEQCTCPECGAAQSMSESIRAWTEWGFRPHDQANPAPAEITRKLVALIIASAGLLAIMIVPRCVNMVQSHNASMAAMDAALAAQGKPDEMAMIDAVTDKIHQSGEAATALLTASVWSMAIVFSAWIAIALWHKWKSRQLRLSRQRPPAHECVDCQME